MRWRVIVALTGLDGTVQTHEVSAGGAPVTEPSSTTIGLTLADGRVQKLVGSGRNRYDRSGDVDRGIVDGVGIAIDGHGHGQSDERY